MTRAARWLSLLAGAALAACLAPPLPAGLSPPRLAGDVVVPGRIGIVADDATNSVTAFDPLTGAVLGTVSLPDGPAIGDCLLSRDGRFGFVTDFNSRVWVIDLTGPVPALAAGTNPIPISNPGEDLSLTPDGRFLVVCDGADRAPVSVIDLTTRTEVSTLEGEVDSNSVVVCDDGSVLVTSFFLLAVERLTIDAAGQLDATGERLDLSATPINLVCAPGSNVGLVILRNGSVQSFSIPGLKPLDSVNLSQPEGISGAIDPRGNRVFIRSTNAQGERLSDRLQGGLGGVVLGGAVDVFALDPVTGALGDAPLLTIPVASARTFYGMEQLALMGNRLFIPEPSQVRVVDASTGEFLFAITGKAISRPTGIAVPEETSLCQPPPPSTPGVRAIAFSSLLLPEANATLFVLARARRSGRTTGSVSYQNPAAGIVLRSIKILSVVRDGAIVRIYGRGVLNRRRPVDFVVELVDQVPGLQGGDLAMVEICGVHASGQGFFPRGHGVILQ